MKYDIILCGVGGQGVLSIATIIAKAAMKNRLQIRQSEVHGMSQRGGAVVAHLRISDSKIFGDLIPRGGADLIISMEPLESLRYVDYLKSDGKIITSKKPFLNIDNYCDLDELYSKIKLIKNSAIIDAEELAKNAGSVQSANMVLVGNSSNLLPLDSNSFIEAIQETFKNKGEQIIATNITAFHLGKNNV